MDEIFLPKENKRARLQQFLETHQGEKRLMKRLAEYCGVDRRTPFNWTKPGGPWPTGQKEARLWEFIRKSDETALTVTHTESDPDTISIEQYKQLLLLAPQDAEKDAQLKRVRSHLRNQITLFLEMLLVERGLVPQEASPPTQKGHAPSPSKGVS